jgi:hypothetical protein
MLSKSILKILTLLGILLIIASITKHEYAFSIIINYCIGLNFIVKAIENHGK